VYADPVLPDVLAGMAVSVLISGLNSTKVLLANRKLMLGRVSLLELLSQVVGTIVMIVLAWLNPTIWAIVIGAIVTSLVKMLLSHIVIPGSPNQLEWDTVAFHELFHFGKWIFISTILGFLLHQGDRLILGGFISSELMGVYLVAFFLSNSVKEAIMKINSAVFFPVLSEVVRGRRAELSNAYYKIRRWIDGIAFFSAGFLCVTGTTIVCFLYDERYQAAGWMLQVLSFSLVSIGYLLAGQCFFALGKARLVSALAAIQVLVLYISLPLAYYVFGFLGAVYAIALNPLARVLAAIWFMNKCHLLQIRNEFVMLPLFFIGSGVGMIVNNIIR